MLFIVKPFKKKKKKTQHLIFFSSFNIPDKSDFFEIWSNVSSVCFASV